MSPPQPRRAHRVSALVPGGMDLKCGAPGDTAVAFMLASHPLPMLEMMNERHLLLITARDCHLCARARAVLAQLSLEAREVDVGSAEAQQLAASGVPLVLLPVLWDGERVLAYGRFSERALRRRLAI